MKGAKGIFALGDCSTIEQKKMIAKAEELFSRGDVNKDGELTLEEFTVLIEQAKKEYPQVSLFFSRAQKNIDRYTCTCTCILLFPFMYTYTAHV